MVEMDLFEQEERSHMQDWLDAISITGYVPSESESNVKYRRHYHNPDDDDDSDGYHGYQPTDSDSTDDGYTDDSDDQPQAVRPARRYYPPPPPEDSITSWYQNRPFQYNGRMAVVAIPGILLTLALGGDILVAIVTLGMLMVHLFMSAEEENKSLIAYLMAFVCVQLSVVYSAVPLIWKSVFNVILIVALNMFTVLTGGWIMLSFDKFREREPELVSFIEAMLFAVYPAVSVVLITWTTVTLTTVAMAPYCFLFSGFAVLQIFLAPTPTSFAKVSPKGQDVRLVLDHNLVGLVAVVYTLCTPTLYILTRIVQGGPVQSLEVFMEWCMLSTASIFLTSFFRLRRFLESVDIPFSNMIKARWISGVLTMYLIGPVLRNYGVTSHLLPWLPLATTAYAFNGALLSRRMKTGTRILLAAMVAISVSIVMLLPWKLEYYLSESIPISMLYSILLLNAVLCVLGTYCASTSHRELFGGVWILQTLVCVLGEKILVSNEMLPYPAIPAIALMVNYLAARLGNIGLLSWQHSLAIGSLHISLALAVPFTSPDQSSPWGVLQFTVTFIHTLTLLVILGYERSPEISRSKLLQYTAAVAVTSFVNTIVYEQNIVTRALQMAPQFSYHLASMLALVSLVTLKMTFIQKCYWMPGRGIPVITMVMSALLFLLAPQITLDRTDLSKWAMLFGLLGSGVGVQSARVVRSTPIQVVTSFVLGVPLGFLVASVLYGEKTSVPEQLVYSWLSSLCLLLLWLAWKQGPKTEKHIKFLYALVTFSSIAAISVDIFSHYTEGQNNDIDQDASDDPITHLPGCLAAAIVMVTQAAILKSMSFMHLKLPTNEGSGIDGIQRPLWPLLGNISSISSFILLCVVCPTHYTQIWVTLCTSVLLLLQRDHLILSGLNHLNYLTPVVMTTMIFSIIGTVVNSEFWTTKSSWLLLGSSIELLMVLATLPMVWNILLVNWFGHEFGQPKVIFFLLPLYTVMFLSGTSYSCWFLASYGFVAGIWMVTNQLALEQSR